ncbi:heme exporter protein A [Aquicella lusitana]|uniref:Heme exporter protein A n=2 Tax=Aquicella lusitana TaxID=254246 RepID=A0A370GSB4_9COXI|nr:heme exporter protein A [Aquicella lusitana]
MNLGCIRQHKTLFTHISFSLIPGHVLFVEGPNGSGKSSLLRLLTGLSTPSEGDVFWDGTPIQHLRAAYWHHLHYVGHPNGIKTGLTVTENLRLICQLGLSTSAIAYDTVLSMLQLDGDKNTQAKFLSAGQKRRLALAKLFLVWKPLWLLDEPLTALDHQTQQLFLFHLENHLQKGGIAVISSHHAIAVKSSGVQTLRLQPC